MKAERNGSGLDGRAMAAYEALLARHLDSTKAAVRQAGTELQFDGRPLCRSLQPLFLERSFHDTAMRGAALVVRALEATVAHMGSRLGLSPRMAELVRLGLARPSVAVTRLDGLLDGNRLRFLESNALGQATMPAGLSDGDHLRAAFRAMPVVRALEERFELHDCSTLALVVDAVVALHRARGGTGLPRIAIIDVRGHASGGAAFPMSVDDRERLHIIQQSLARGFWIRQCTASDLRFAGDHLRLGDDIVDLVFISDDSATYLEVCPDDDPILAALRAGAIALGDGFPVSRLAHDKKAFAYLTDPEIAVPLDAETAAAVRAHVPWSRICRPGPSTYHDEPIDLLRFVADHRERLVLKPTTGFGGRGVVLGWTVSPAAWSDAVTRVFHGAEDHLVQERVPSSRIRLFMLDDGGVERATWLTHDLNPFVFGGGHADGWWARVSSSELLNVTSGDGSEVPVFVVDSRDEK